MSSDAAFQPVRRRGGRLGIAAGLIAIGLSACSSLDRRDAEMPDVSLAGLSFAEAGLFEQGFTVQLRMKNPNDFDIPVDALDFVLDVNGARFAEGLSSKDFILPASAEVIVPIDVAISTNDLIDRVTAIGTGRRLDYELNGSAEIASWFTKAVPFHRSGKLALPDIPGLFQEDLPVQADPPAS
ncbi:MAG: LEA type 2 family protein [Alphaproteobacteria bacterium]